VKVDKATSNLAAARAALADAQRQAAAADEARQQIRGRVATGDAKVRGADLADADQAVDLAGLRLEAAAKNVEHAEHAHRQAEHDQLLADIDSLREGTGRDQVGAALEHVDDALTVLGAVVDDQRSRVQEIIQRASTLQPLPPRLRLNGGRLQVGQYELSGPNLSDLVAGLLGVREHAKYDNPPDLPGVLRVWGTDKLRSRYRKPDR
jgi:hypothetical protein